MFALLKHLFCLFFLIYPFKVLANKKYCGATYCNNSKQHTLCKFQSSDPARHCLDHEMTIRTAEDKQAILDKLNSRRNKVASGDIRSLPSAKNMMKLEWNEELELSAQRWADQCVKHSSPDIKDTCRDLGSMPVGQNIASIYGEAPGLTPLALLDVWYMELLNVNASVLPRYQKSKDAGYSQYDYFTQLVWAQSNQVGCGAVKFKERLQDSGDKKRLVYRLVCNFAPGGNVINQTVYEVGPPCSKCANNGSCDSVYTALCGVKLSTTKPKERTKFELTTNIFLSKFVKDHRRTEKATVTSHRIDDSLTDPEDEDIITPIDFFTHTHEFVRQPLSTTPKPMSSCKDLLAVDDFVEILRKKLSTDPMLKDLLQSSMASPAQADSGFTDALALIGNIYSKNIPLTTTQLPNKDYVNSTLLVNLVEAVIFRNSISDKVKNTNDMIKTTEAESFVSPVKIQAEFAKVNHNSEFTGHLFFPEDIDENGENAQSTELYYDATYPSSEIEDFRRSQVTKDFLDEILDTDFIAESTTKSDDDFSIRTKPRVLLRKQRMKRHISVYQCNEKGENIGNGCHNVPCSNKRILQSNYIVVKYRELLRRLASDIKVFQLNKRFHCSAGSRICCSFVKLMLFIISKISLLRHDSNL